MMMSVMVALCSTAAEAAPYLHASREEVLSLPGWRGAPPTKHWSGFVEVEPGTHLFYYLVESTNAPSTDPLIWWMNGGPGASSLVGLFQENGPLLLNSSFQLTPNPYAFNTKANVLYVEFGPGIGYSYCANSSRSTTGGCPQSRGDCSPCYASDSSVARQSAKFLSRLVSEKALFPELAGALPGGRVARRRLHPDARRGADLHGVGRHRRARHVGDGPLHRQRRAARLAGPLPSSSPTRRVSSTD